MVVSSSQKMKIGRVLECKPRNKCTWESWLGLGARDHLGSVCMVGLKFVPQCTDVKLLEVMSICFCLESISSIHILNIVVESDCLEFVSMLNDVTVDLSKVSFFVVEAKK